MKILSTAIFTFLYLSVYAQDSINTTPGYCGTVKLKDINAAYGEVIPITKFLGTPTKIFYFDYGQVYKSTSDVMVNAGSTKPLLFNSIAQMINFFDFNGWDYLSTLNFDGNYTFLFKKKK